MLFLVMLSVVLPFVVMLSFVLLGLGLGWVVSWVLLRNKVRVVLLR
jgi:hypothetical protein